MTTDIDIQELFGDRYKIEYEDSYYAERSEFRTEAAPWLLQIPCRHGTIGVWDDERLFASTRRRGKITRLLMALPFVDVAQDGDDGVTVLFPVGQFELVADIMAPKKRRRLSEAERARFVAAGREHQFQPGHEPVLKGHSRDPSPFPGESHSEEQTAQIEPEKRHEPHEEVGPPQFARRKASKGEPTQKQHTSLDGPDPKPPRPE